MESLRGMGDVLDVKGQCVVRMNSDAEVHKLVAICRAFNVEICPATPDETGSLDNLTLREWLSWAEEAHGVVFKTGNLKKFLPSNWTVITVRGRVAVPESDPGAEVRVAELLEKAVADAQIFGEFSTKI